MLTFVFANRGEHMNPKSLIRVLIIPAILAVVGIIGTISCNEEYQYSLGSIMGTITDAKTGEKLSDCTISVSDSEGTIVDRSNTDSDGNYKTKGLSEGTYTLTAEKKDYSEASKSVQIKAGENTQCDIALNWSLEPPVLNVSGVSNIDKTSATLTGEIVNPGNPAYTSRGFTCSLTSKDDNAPELLCEVNDNAVFSHTVTGLTAGKKYYVRAFAVNEKDGKVWSSNEVSFTTTESYPQVRTDNASELDVINGSCTLNGYIEHAGAPAYSERGFCVSNNGDPTVSDTKCTVSGTGTGSFSYLMTGLAKNQNYRFRAYVVQNGRITYGEVKSFDTTSEETSVSTSGATNVTPSSATLNGSVLKIGSPAYTEKGFCYSTSPSPSISSTKVTVSGSGDGDFSSTINGLTYNTTYYYKAYAIQNGGAVYGSEVSFNTGYTATVVETNSSVKGITYSNATLAFSIKTIGDPGCTEAGICYGTSSTPTINSDRVKGAVATYSQSLSVSGLTESTTYFFRAYAIQNGEAVYGSIFSFKTATRPSVSTLAVTNLQNQYNLVNMWEVQLNGRVDSIGDPAISSRGFRYGTSGDPTSSGSIVSASGATTGAFTIPLTGLKSNTTYYVRAYVRNSLGFEYGELVTFTTGD